jgi:MFS family permease
VLAIYLGKLGFSGTQIGAVYGTMALASIFSPIVFGQIADRWLPTQHLLAGLHLGGAVMLYMVTRFSAFTPFYVCVLIYGVLFIPTISLTNALSFHHIQDAARHFPSMLACGLSVILGVYCLILPHTPPRGRPGDALPFVKAVGLLRESRFSLFIVVSFILSIVLAGYFSFTPPFLKSEAVNMERVAPVASIMTVGQFTEMLLLPFLPFFLKRIGMKWTLALGMAAWGIRYAIFSLGLPLPAIILAIALHGICYDFFFVAAYIHVDNQATGDMRASAQALFNIVTMGLGMWLGNMAFGALNDHFTTGAGTPAEAVAWQPFWAYPALGVLMVLIVFALGFREKKPAAPVA